MQSDQLEIGAVFHSRYRVDALLGEGGMALVYLVTELGDVPTLHALKLIRRSAFSNEVALAIAKERFRLEAEIQARVRSLHVVTIHRYDLAEDGTPYLLMEYLDGEDLATVLRRCKTLPFQVARLILSQVARALAVLHGLGMVHRDLSPANIFLVRQGDQAPEAEVFVKLLDFGISKSAKVQGVPLTDPALRIGNPPYMAPECILRKRKPASGDTADSVDAESFDARADQFSLAAIFFEMLAGYRAFLPNGDDPSVAFGMVLNADPLSYEDLPPCFTPVLREILGRALSKTPSDRFLSVGEFVAALNRIEAEPKPHAELNPTGVPNSRLSMQLALWIGLAFISLVLCATAYEPELKSLFFSPQPQVPRSVHELPDLLRNERSDLAQPTADLAIVDAATRDAAIPDETVPIDPVVRPPPIKTGIKHARKQGCVVKFDFQDSKQEDAAKPVLDVFRQVIAVCLAQCAAVRGQIEIVSMRELHADWRERPTENSSLSRCLNERMPKGKVLPKRARVMRER